MNLIVWAKTLLTVQKYQDRMIGALKAIIQKRALASIHNGPENQAMLLSKDILKMLRRKENLATLAILTNKALSAIREDSAQILILSFIDEKSKEQIAKDLSVCERTIYRKMNAALQEFASYIESLGYTCENLQKICETEEWILNTYRWVEEETMAKQPLSSLTKTFEFSDSKRKLTYFKQFKSNGMEI